MPEDPRQEGREAFRALLVQLGNLNANLATLNQTLSTYAPAVIERVDGFLTRLDTLMTTGAAASAVQGFFQAFRGQPPRQR